MAFRALTSFLTFALACRSTIAATLGPVGDLAIAAADVSPDGFDRTAITAGGSVIGTTIVGNKGDNFQINVVNNLDDDTMLKTTSIHWHGLFQAGTNWADGPAFINQCPIASGNSFLYDFTAVGQAGTFWYHSHLSTQYCDGLRGAFVIYDPDDPYLDDYDVDDESTVITLADWYHAKAETLTFPASDATLINGLGRYNGGNATDLSVITVEQGTRYRFRLVNVACDPNFVFSIDGHSFTVIEVDGVNHEPLEVDSIQIFAGQRYSIIFTADQDVDNYWIRANPSTGTTGFSGGINSAILRYSGAEEAEPGTEDDSSNLLVEADLVPLENPGAPGDPEVGGVDLAINLAFAFTGTAFTVNGETFTPPTVPVLLQILSGAQTADTLLPEGSVYSLPLNSTIEVSMPGGALVGGPHPFHLHGHTFDVVRSAGQTDYNYANPPRRDVVALGTSATDNVTIRFTTDNAGPWFLHCHIDWHLEAGLAIVFAEGTDSWASVITPTDQWNQLCPIYDALDDSEL